MFGFSQFKENLQGKIGLFDATDVQVEEKLRCWCSFCSSWAPESEFVGHYLIHWPMLGFSQFKENLQGKIGLFDATDVLVEEKLRWWCSFCSSWAPESEYVGHYLIHWPMFGFSQFKENLQGKIGLFDATDVLVEEKLRCWCSFCSSWAPESTYVGHFRIH